MSTQGLSKAQLLSCGDADFDNNIKNMAVKELMGLISSLQKEMAKEQENFNGLSSALQGLKDRNSRQYKTISRDMVASQGRLTTLMNRSMKCFSQLKDHDFLPAKQNLESGGQGGGDQLQRRNSSKAAGSTSPNSSSPVKTAASVQRSRSLYTVNQPDDTSNDSSKHAPNTTAPQASTPQPASSSNPVVYRGGVGGGVTRARSDRTQVRRPASVAVVGGGVNGVAAAASSNDGSNNSPRVASAAADGKGGDRVSVGVASSASLSSLNIQPQAQHQPVVMGVSGRSGSSSSGGGGFSGGLGGSYTGGGPLQGVRSRSQILITPSVPASTPLAKAFANVRQQQSPRSNSNNASSSQTSHASLLTHASSQPSLAASTSSTSSAPTHPTPSSQGPGASSSSPSSSSPDGEKGFNGLPSVRQLARAFGASGSSGGQGGQTNPTTDSSPATTKPNYRPVIRAQSVASADASSRRPNLTSSASANKVNGVPAAGVAAGGRTPSFSTAAGQSAKRAPAPKPPAAGGGGEPTANGQSEFEKIHSKLRATRELNLAALPDKPVSVTSQPAHGDASSREVSYFTTNLDRQKSSSSIALGQKSNFDNNGGISSNGTSSPAGTPVGAGPSQGPIRRAQSREELYAIESKARGQKDALMKQIGAAAAGRKASTDQQDDEAYNNMPVSGQWGLKGNSLLAQRLQKAYISPTYRVISPRWPERRSYTPRHFFVGGVRTKLIGANSYHNYSRSPQRLILCGGGASWMGKITTSSSTAELSRTGVYCSNEDLRDHDRRLSASRRAVSCEDVRGTHTPGWDSRFSESGVSLNDSRGTDLASLAGTEPEDADVDGVSQCSFGSSSAFHEITCDSEFDRISDTVSVPGSTCGGHDRTLDVVHEGEGDEGGGGGGGGGGGRDGRSHHRKTRHDSGSREKFLSELNAAASATASCGTSSGRSSPSWDGRSQQKEFDHSTPTKRGSPALLSVFPGGEEEDLHFPPIQSAKVSSASSPSLYLPIPISPVLSQRLKEGKRGKKSPSPPRDGADSTASGERTTDTVRESLQKSRREFFSSLGSDGSSPTRLEAEQTAGESVQSWLTTGHTQRHRGTTADKSLTNSQQEALQDQLQQTSLKSSPTSSPKRPSVRDRVARLEQGPIVKAANSSETHTLQVEQRSIDDNRAAEKESSSDRDQGHVNEALLAREDHKEKVDEIADGLSPPLSPRLQTERSSRENRKAEIPLLPASSETEGGVGLLAPSSHQTDPSVQTASSQHVERALRQTNTADARGGGGEGGQLSSSSPRFQKLSHSSSDLLHPDSSSSEADKNIAGNITVAQTSQASGEYGYDADGSLDTTDSSLASAHQETSAVTDRLLAGVIPSDSETGSENVTDAENYIASVTETATESEACGDIKEKITGVIVGDNHAENYAGVIGGNGESIFEVNDGINTETGVTSNGDQSVVCDVVDWGDSNNVNNTAAQSITSPSDRKLRGVAGRETESDSNYHQSEDRIGNKGSNSRPGDRVFSRNVNNSWLGGAEGEEKLEGLVAYEEGTGRDSNKGEEEKGEEEGVVGFSIQNAEQTQHDESELTPYSSTSPLSRRDNRGSCDVATSSLTSTPCPSTTTRADFYSSTSTLAHTPTLNSASAASTHSLPDAEHTINSERVSKETGVGVVKAQAHDGSDSNSERNPNELSIQHSDKSPNTDANMMDGPGTKYCSPEATRFIDRSEEVLPGSTVTKEEVSCRRNTTTRHVRRTTTVEETVTTHRTVRHGDAASVLDPLIQNGASGKVGEAFTNPTASSADTTTTTTLLLEGESRSAENGFGSHYHKHAPQNGHADVSSSGGDSTVKLDSALAPSRVGDFVTEDTVVRTTRTVREEDSEREETTTTTKTTNSTTASKDAAQFTPRSLPPAGQPPIITGSGNKAGSEKEVDSTTTATTAPLVTATAETQKGDQSFTPVDSLTSTSVTTATTSHPCSGTQRPVITETSQQLLQQQQGKEEVENTAAMAGKGGGVQRQVHPTNNASFNLLDSLEEQLSLLSSPEDLSFSDGARYHSSRSGGACGGYRDHAEASLPHQQRHNDSENTSDFVRGNGSVSITLDKSYHQASTYSFPAYREGSSVTDYHTDYLISHGSSTPRDDASRLRHARVSQGSATAWVEEGGKAFASGEDKTRERSGQQHVTSQFSASQRSTTTTTGLTWRAPASLSSSSSEWDDSDGNYSSISTTDSHGQHESDFPTSEGPEDYDNVNSFHDFVSGLHGQSNSDQPGVDFMLGAPEHHRSSSSLLRNSFIQETILEADDESETADEADTTANSTVSSFRSSLHFSVPPPESQSTPRMQYVNPVPEIKLWSTDQHLSDLSASGDGDMTLSLDPAPSPVRSQQHSLLQELSDRLSSVSGAGGAGDLSHDLSFTLNDSRHHYDPEMSDTSRHSACASPTPSDVSETGSMYSTSATAEVRREAEMGTSFKSAELTPVTHKLSRRNLASAFDNSSTTKTKSLLTTSSVSSSKSRKSQWVHEKILLFQRLLNDLEWQSRSSEQKLLDEMVALETGRRGGDSTSAEHADEGFSEKHRTEGLCEDLYREFTRDFQEKRQSHVCPFVEDHLPSFRFRRFLRRKHNSRLKGSNYRRTFRLRHRLDRLVEMDNLEMQSSGGKSVSDTSLALSPPYHLHSPISKLSLSPRLGNRLVSDVFTADDVDVKRSFSSDSAYSTLSGGTSRNVSELDSTLRSMGDVSSIATDVSLDDGMDKMRCLSDVFDQLDVCEGQIDSALLDRLSTGYYKADTL